MQSAIVHFLFGVDSLEAAKKLTAGESDQYSNMVGSLLYEVFS